MDQAKPGNRYLFATAVVAIAILGSVYALWSPVVRQRRGLAVRHARLRGAVEALWKRGVALDRTRDALLQDPLMVESVARRHLGYRLRGEIVHRPATEQVVLAAPVAKPAPRRAPTPADTSGVPRRRRRLSAFRGAVLPSLSLLLVGVALGGAIASYPLVSHLRSKAITPRS